MHHRAVVEAEHLAADDGGVLGEVTDGDVDVFSFVAGAGTINVAVNPSARSGNVDIQAELLDHAQQRTVDLSHVQVLVLDEATAMLDPRGRDEVLSTVRKLNRERGIKLDITFKGGRLYCAALNSTVILDVRDLVNDQGRVARK